MGVGGQGAAGWSEKPAGSVSLLRHRLTLDEVGVGCEPLFSASFGQVSGSFLRSLIIRGYLFSAISLLNSSPSPMATHPSQAICPAITLTLPQGRAFRVDQGEQLGWRACCRSGSQDTGLLWQPLGGAQGRPQVMSVVGLTVLVCMHLVH